MTDGDADLDSARLESYLAGALDEPTVGTELLHDGLNLAVGVSTADDDRAYVLRRPNKLRRTEVFNDPAREYRLLERLRETAIPAPEPVLYCDDESILGDEFFVTTYLDGESVPVGASLPERFRDADSRGGVADRLVDTLADVHGHPAGRFDDACDRLDPLQQVEQLTDRLDEATAVTGRDVTDLREVADWLRAHPPADPETALLHGDFKPGNVLFAETGRPEISGVLDWEAALLGDPRTELGYFLLYWRDEGDPTPSLDPIESRYDDEDRLADVREIAASGLCPFTGRPGSPSRRELVARYEAATGLDFERDRFYRAHAALGLATVWEDLHRHADEAGADSDREPLLDYTAMLARSIVDGEFPL